MHDRKWSFRMGVTSQRAMPLTPDDNTTGAHGSARRLEILPNLSQHVSLALGGNLGPELSQQGSRLCFTARRLFRLLSFSNRSSRLLRFGLREGNVVLQLGDGLLERSDAQILVPSGGSLPAPLRRARRSAGLLLRTIEPCK
jgi:hypothetical protein